VRAIGSLCFAAAIVSCSCASKTQRKGSETSSAVTTGSGCDLTPVNSKGELRACAGGMSTAEGPGIPYNSTGVVDDHLPLSAADLAAIAAANALGVERAPAGMSPVDLGFAPLPGGSQP
jgi:hypothetical protein